MRAGAPSLLLAVALAVTSGCRREAPAGHRHRSPSRSAPQPVPAAQAAAQAATATGGKPAAAASQPALPASLAGVADLSLAVVSAKAMVRARQLNRRGYRLYRAKKLKRAAQAFTRALQADPGHLTARYNLACVLALQGQGGRALTLLGQFRRAGCVLCRKQLASAARDEDFAALRTDGRFRRLTDGVSVTEPDYRAVARRVLAALRRGDSGPAVVSVRAGRAVLVASTWEDLSDGADPPRPSYRLLRTAAGARELALPLTMNEAPFPLQVGRVDRCRGTCCTVRGDGGGMNVRTVERLCLWPVDAQQAVLVSLELTLYGA